MASSISWCTYYYRHHRDGGVLQRSLEVNAETWDKVTLSHTDEPSIMKTLNTLPESTFFVVPAASSGNVNYLHHGFSHTAQIGGASILSTGTSRGLRLRSFRPNKSSSLFLAQEEEPGPGRNCPSLSIPK